MSTLRISNIEAKADISNPTVNEKVKITNSSGRVLVQVDGSTAGITSVGINTTNTSFTFDEQQNVQFVGDIKVNNINPPVGVSTVTFGSDISVTGNVNVSGSVNGYGRMVLETAKASTSGTSVDFTGIPSWVKRITVMFNGMSTNGTSNIVLHIGDSGGVETTGYVSGNVNINPSTSVFTSTTGFLVDASVAATSVIYGIVVLQNISGNTWIESGTVNNAGAGKISNGSKTLSDTLDRIRITTGNGTDTFDAGSINILYEGY